LATSWRGFACDALVSLLGIGKAREARARPL
jgi:hypothetical protein